VGKEIERKFLVPGDFPRETGGGVRITQGYLSSVPERTVRVRIMGDRGFLTVKGIGNTAGVSRFEWEQEIPVRDAEQLLALCEPGVIDKVRHRVPVGSHTFEVDEFHGENEGLRLAELELRAEDEPFRRPAWLGAEVTGDPRYYNAALMKHPFTRW
jgi:adenylate cyclase